MPTIAVWQKRSEARSRALVLLVVLVFGSAMVLLGLGFVASFLYPSKAIGKPSTLAGAGQAESYAIGEPRSFKEGRTKFWVARQEDGTFLAFSAVDSHHTHCEVSWRPAAATGIAGKPDDGRGVFKTSGEGACPGSTYAINGSRLFGPSPCHLSRYPVSVSPTGIVVVNISKHARIGMPDPKHRIACY